MLFQERNYSIIQKKMFVIRAVGNFAYFMKRKPRTEKVYRRPGGEENEHDKKTDSG